MMSLPHLAMCTSPESETFVDKTLGCVDVPWFAQPCMDSI